MSTTRNTVAEALRGLVAAIERSGEWDLDTRVGRALTVAHEALERAAAEPEAKACPHCGLNWYGDQAVCTGVGGCGR